MSTPRMSNLKAHMGLNKQGMQPEGCEFDMLVQSCFHMSNYDFSLCFEIPYEDFRFWEFDYLEFVYLNHWIAFVSFN